MSAMAKDKFAFKFASHHLRKDEQLNLRATMPEKDAHFHGEVPKDNRGLCGLEVVPPPVRPKNKPALGVIPAPAQPPSDANSKEQVDHMVHMVEHMLEKCSSLEEANKKRRSLQTRIGKTMQGGGILTEEVIQVAHSRASAYLSRVGRDSTTTAGNDDSSAAAASTGLAKNLPPLPPRRPSGADVGSGGSAANVVMDLGTGSRGSRAIVEGGLGTPGSRAIVEGRLGTPAEAGTGSRAIVDTALPALVLPTLPVNTGPTPKPPPAPPQPHDVRDNGAGVSALVLPQQPEPPQPPPPLPKMPPEPPEGQAELLRRVRRMYIEKVIRNSECLVYDERVDLRSSLPHPMSHVATVLAHIAVTCYWVVALTLAGAYAVHLRQRTAYRWLYACIWSWLFSWIVLEGVKIFLATVRELQQLQMRRRLQDHRSLKEQVMRKKALKTRQMQDAAEEARLAGRESGVSLPPDSGVSVPPMLGDASAG
eukprot:gnl/TRDRNA2_/TRDRNA2_174762_c1_seq10.p1 gnl/TRDRNA2_/TRDRNA2_174762_c1~~gnl/TRDRNA2_/TRDRNA2_174762_c1_seq10.p1  ORF type:complete len:513 (+),score=94.84 gnl/TRDRNA2_/TRDRNA2_174762_c1_seq10:106-1539(+)